MKHFKLMKGVLACLLSLALVFSCFTTVDAKAAGESSTSGATVAAPTAVDATYDWAKNVIKSTVNQKAYVYVLKAEKGNTIKAGASANGQLDKGEISLTDLKVKANNKNTYFYVCDKEFEAEGKSIDANLVIKATAVKKATAVIDYTQADNKASLKVISVSATDKDKKKIADAKAFWSTEANGTYYAVDDSTASTTRKYADNTTAAKNGFDGRTLYEMLEAGGGVIYVKVAGVDGGSGTAQFASKAIKVKVAKQGKAPSVKLDVKKDTFSFKNGMDFGLFTKTTNNGTDTYTLVGEWNTVLPYLKTAATKTLDDSVVLGSTYLPLGKKEDNAAKAITDGKVSYTSLKVKTIGFDKLTDQLVISSSGEATASTVGNGTYYVGVRTAATDKKPASAVTYFKLVDKTEAPIVYTESKVDGQYLVASGSEFAKKGFVIGTIANWNGEDGTEGYDDEFKLKTTAGSGADTNAASYEYTIVKTSDYVGSGSGSTIDWSTVSWKKLDAAKTKINGKMKSKYNDLSGKKVEATLKAGSLSGEATDVIPATVDTLLLVRRAGVKGKTADDAVLASEIIELYVVKNSSKYEIYSTKSIGAEAFSYTVDFYKWSLSGESTYVWKKDDTLTVTGWGNGSTEKAEIAAITNADLFALTGDNNTIADDKTSLSGGKLVVEVEDEDITQKYAIREYANVEIVAAISGETTTKTLAKIVNGKSSISGDATTVYYVGKEIEIDYDVISANEPSESGYTFSIKKNVTSPETGFAKVDANGEKISTTVNTAENTVIKVTYTKTPVTKNVDFLGYSNEDYDYEIVDKSFSEQPHKATYGVDVKFTVKAATGKNIKSVQYKIGSDESIQFKTLTEVNGVYTIPGTEILDAVKIKVEVEAASQGGNG